METTKQRIVIFIEVFKYGLTLFIAAGAALVTYIEKNPKLDLIHGILAALMILGISIGIPCLVEADKQASLLDGFQK